MRPEQIAPIVFFGIAAVLAVVSLIIWCLICYFLSNCLKAVPQEHRKMEPGMVWLLLIPCFNLVWNFFVFLRIPDSFKSYFDATGQADVGDCGRGIGLAYAICCVCSMVPYLGVCVAIASLVLLILFLVKINDFKNRVLAVAAQTPPPAEPPSMPVA